MFQKLIFDNCPCTLNLKHDTAPWITDELQLIHDRNHSLKQYKIHNLQHYMESTYLLRNCANNLKTQLKMNYFSTQLEENQKNPKRL